jgi:hypothetical protein
MMRLFIATCVCLIGIVGQAGAQSFMMEPDRLREGDGKTRDVALRATVTPGATLSVAVGYKSDPSASATNFIPKFSVKDNASEDSNPQDGNIRLVLPRKFEKIGVYVIEIDEPRLVLSLVYEPNNSSYFGQFVDWLVKAAGGGVRGGSDTALKRIQELTNNKDQDKVAVLTVPVPAAGQEIERKMLKLNIRSALMPSWSMNGTYLACSAWRNEKWLIAGYAINGAGVATELWQWKSSIPGVSDFSPAWSPQGDGIVFVRLDQDQKSNIWALELDRSRRPRKETKLTTIGNIQSILGWDKDLGILFETFEGNGSFRQVWALKLTVPKTQVTPLSDEYGQLRGAAPRRRSVFYIDEKDSPPMSRLYEVNSQDKLKILTEQNCSHRWLAVSSDERWLAFDSNCPLTAKP